MAFYAWNRSASGVYFGVEDIDIDGTDLNLDRWELQPLFNRLTNLENSPYTWNRWQNSPPGDNWQFLHQT